MDFELTDEQRDFHAVVRAFVDKQIIPVANEWERAGRYPTEIIDTMKRMGLFGLTVPESYGGLGVDKVSFALVFEEISRGWLGVAATIGSHSVSCSMIARHGTEEQKQRFLPDLASGARRTGIALTEPDRGSDLQGITTRAYRDGEHYVIRGTKTWITDARHAYPLPVLVKTMLTEPAHKGMSILLVDTTSAGFTVSKDLPERGDRGTGSCEIVLDDVRVPIDALLGGVEGRGMQQALSGLEIGRINTAAGAVGVAQAAYDSALDCARKRCAFGRPVAEFQAIQLKLADMATEIQAARLLTYWAASRSDGGNRADMEAEMAKYFASETAIRASLDAMRVHGGRGYSQESTVERLYREAPLMAIDEGTNEIQRTVIAKALLSGDRKVGW
jgi:alkylation response protein AidB-like acyl-CoA dehydrogenase